jgi:protein dithiol oxidoreductase (disulfide-forming)
MKKYLTGWLAAASLALFSFALPAHAQLTVGTDYVVIDPAQTTDNPTKIEVTEYFSYACPHCNDLNPSISKWAAKLPADVSFKRVPVNFNPFYQLMARLFYTLEAIHELDRLNDAVFDAIHVKGLRLIDDKSIQEWVTSQGVDAKKFSDAYSSFGVASKVSRGNQLARDAKIGGVPAITVDGRYLVVGKNVKSHAELLALADKVIDKVRAERSSKKK